MTASRPNDEAIFHAARAIPDPDRRRAYVREVCGGDEARIAHVAALLAAAALGVSLSTAEKDWAYARSWLRVAIDRISEHWP